DTPPGCQSGFTPAVPGRRTCDYPNVPSCSYTDSVGRLSYCQVAGPGTFQGPGGCFVGDQGIDRYCTSDSSCSPGEKCGPTSGGPSTMCTGAIASEPG